jgi:hypothetical protein
MKLAAITQIKNESNRLREWIIYHSKVHNFDHFLFYLDKSQDDSEEVLKSLQSDFSIEIKKTDESGEYTVDNLCNDDAIKRQERSFTEGYNLLKFDFDWIIIFDVDEWIVPNDIDDFNFKDDLSDATSSSLYIQSYDFKPPFDIKKSITEQIFRRWSDEEKSRTLNCRTGKSILRGKSFLENYIQVSSHGPINTPSYYRSQDWNEKYKIHHFRSHLFNGGIPYNDNQYTVFDDSIKKIFEKYNLI